MSEHAVVWSLRALIVLAISTSLTAFAIRYARRRELFDVPGHRRSHSTPTPRGGGIGLVAATIFVLATSAWAAAAVNRGIAAALAVAVVLVAGIGWLDDHRGVPARVRFSTHCFAAAIVLATPFGTVVGATTSPLVIVLASALAVIASLALVWSINLHNFMDGIDGILAAQAIFVFGVLSWYFARAGNVEASGSASLFALAVLGFLPFNFPRSRVFMGDVGSGTLGLLIGVVVLWQMTSDRIALMSGFVAASAFVVDATATLVSRVLRQRRWYSAHREHLYQWLVRIGFSHAAVVAMYMAWNLAIVLPVIVLMNQTPAARQAVAIPSGMAYALATYAIGCGIWWFGKRACLAAQRSRSHA